MVQTRQPRPFGESVRWRMVSLAFDRGCGLDVDGATYCWGRNSRGQLGMEPDSLRHPAPVRIPGLPPLLNLATSRAHTCGLTADGEVYCWGENQHGELGRGARTPWEPAGPVAGDLDFVSVVAYLNTTCALTPAGEPYCWGSSQAGELGYLPEESCADVHEVNVPGRRPAFLCSSVPSAAEIELRFKTYDFVSEHSACGVTRDGVGYCWEGDMERGDGMLLYPKTPSPELMAEGFELKAIAVGERHRCALTEAGQAVCEGRNERGQLGVANSPLRYRMLSAGNDFTCGMTLQNQVFCWGRDWDRGVLGPGVTDTSAEAVEIMIPGLEE
jgi:alpha-tubulin suppressor-like RCC1 family protein